MIGRVDGQVVLVGGAVPGERVTARIERVSKRVAYAWVTAVDRPSPDRRPWLADLRCGGCLYAHIAYPRQLAIKAQVIADAFSRIGKIDLPGDVAVAPSPEEGYRLRARLHVRDRRMGFFREGTHDLCDAGSTRQLLADTVDLVDRLAAGLRSLGVDDATEIEIGENLDASERAIHVALTGGSPARLAALARTEGVTGLAASVGGPRNLRVLGGSPYLVDRLTVGGAALTLRRHVLAFFQGNRYLFETFVDRVVREVPEGGAAVDLYAGGGAFAVAAALARQARVAAVEGDSFAAADLAHNAAQTAGAVRAVSGAVEGFAPDPTPAPDVVIVDPPRTGLSGAALERVVRLAAGRIVYVSCDVATLARDAQRLVAAGYRLAGIQAFDLFPNTPHVETVAVMEKP